MSNSIIKYTSKSFDEIKADLLAYVKADQTTNWTDFSESDIGVRLINMIAAMGDMLSFYQDRQALEVFPDTARERKNVKAILSTFGYKFDPVSSALSLLTLNIPARNFDIKIPAYTRFATSADPDTCIYYSSTSDFYYTSSLTDTQVIIPVLEGIPSTLDIDLSTQTSTYIKFPQQNIEYSSVKVFIDNEEWAMVDDVLSFDFTARNFMMSDDKYDNVYLILPEFIINDKHELSVKYILSSGAAGRVGANTLSFILDPIYNMSTVKPISDFVTIVGNTQSDGGEDPETVEHAKNQAPLEIKTQWVAITLQDFQTLAQGLPGVLKVKALDISEAPLLVPSPYSVKLLIVPEQADKLSAEQKESILSYFSTRKLVTLDLGFLDVDFVDFDIVADIYFKRGTSTIGNRGATIKQNLLNKYSLTSMEFGQSVRLSALTSEIQFSDSFINYIDMKSPLSDLVLTEFQFPRLRSVTINVFEV